MKRARTVFKICIKPYRERGPTGRPHTQLEAYILTGTIHAYKDSMERVSTSGKTLGFLFSVKIFVVFTEYEKINPKKKRDTLLVP